MEEISIDANSDIQATHFFVYKGKRFPFNITLFSLFSNHFKNSEYQLEKNINLVDPEEDINLSDSSIIDFINYCQKNKITLSKDNVPSLHRLAKKYNVISLIKSTEKYMTNHQKDFVIEFLTMPQTDQISIEMTQLEEMLSNNLPDYVDNDQLLKLPLPVLHRVLKKYEESIQKVENTNHQPPKVIEFYFKCLTKFGREASVLFESVDFGSSNGAVINRLMTEFSEKFDFHFINENQLRSIYELESEIFKKEELMKAEFEKMKRENEEKLAKQEEELRKREKTVEQHWKELLEDFEKLKNENEAKLQKQEEEIAKRETKIEQNWKELLEDFEKMKRENEARIAKQEEEIAKRVSMVEQMMKSAVDDVGKSKIELENADRRMADEIKSIRTEMADSVNRLSGQNRDLTEQLREKSGLIEEINGRFEKVAKKQTVFKFVDGSIPRGILAAIGGSVRITNGGSHYDCNPVQFIMSYDNYNFYNYNNYNPSSERDSFIQFDFGQSQKVCLTSYLIRSCSGPNSYNPKTWRIEGSNDESSWTRLDRRANDSSLNDYYKQCNFVCQESRSGQDGRFRYIRYVQEDNWCSDSSYRYRVNITYFELYGEVFFAD